MVRLTVTDSGPRFGDAVTDLPFETIEIDLELRARIEHDARTDAHLPRRRGVVSWLECRMVERVNAAAARMKKLENQAPWSGP